MEAAKEETKEVVDPISEHEPSDLDAPLKGELMYILVIQLKLCIYLFILMHISVGRVGRTTVERTEAG